MVFVIFVVLVGVSAVGEYQGNPLVNSILGSEQPNLGQRSPIWLGRDSVWAVVTGTMCGAVRMHDSLMPTGGFSTLFNLFFADYLGWPRNWNGLLIYLLNSDGVTGLMVGQSFGSQN